jgi:hypothetical protein
MVILPCEVLGNGEEGLLLLALGALHYGSDELLKEACKEDKERELNKKKNWFVIITMQVQEGWPEVVEEVDEESLDVGSIMILISHNHQVSISA